MANEIAKVEVVASDLPDSILRSEKLIERHNMLHNICDYTDELKNYTVPEKDNSGSLVGSPISVKESVLDKIIREHKNAHDDVSVYPEAADSFYTGDLDNTLETMDRAVFKIAKAQARRAENDRCDEAKNDNLLNKLIGAFKGEG